VLVFKVQLVGENNQEGPPELSDWIFNVSDMDVVYMSILWREEYLDDGFGGDVTWDPRICLGIWR
jgi:hypothetical protein